MYIIELIVKLVKKYREPCSQRYMSNGSNDTDYEACEHVFLPIDSTKTVLACSKCGAVVKAKDLRKNPFG